MTPAEDQPVRFNRVVDCHIDDGGYLMPAIYGDVTQFQFSLDSCNADPNLIYNGLFDQDGGSGQGWSISAPTSFTIQPTLGYIQHIAGMSFGFISQSVVIADGVLFVLRFTITQTTGTCNVRLGGTTNWFVDFTGNATGTYEYILTSAAFTYIRFGASLASDASFGSVSINTLNVAMKADLISDADGSVAYADLPYTIYNGYATFSIDWEALEIPRGCYHIEAYDPCTCAQLGGLVGLDLETGARPSAIYTYGVGYWVVDDSWEISAGVANYSGASVPDTSSIFYSNRPLCVGTEYTVTYSIAGLADAQVRVRLGSTSGTWRTADGTYTETLTPTVSGTISFMAQSVGVAGSLSITDVSIVATEPVADYISESYSVRTEDDDCCTKLVSICNDSDAFGMGFVGTGFAPNLRIEAHVRGTNYPSDRNRYIDSTGKSTVYYGRSRKVSELAFDAPEFVHDFMRLAVIADHFFIDGTEYVVDADEYPTMSLNQQDDISGVSLPVCAKVENNMNRRLSDAVRGCGVDGATLGVTGKPTTGGRTPVPRPLGTTEGQGITLDG